MVDVVFRMRPDVLEALRREVPRVAEEVVAAVVATVPAYADPFRGRMGRTIEGAVRVALEGFLDLVARPEGPPPGTQVPSVFEAAYQLGRGEARAGRAMDALSSAYRSGARTAWRDLSATAARLGLSATEISQFAELVFAYIDELSDASLRGHVEELASSGRLRQRRLERLFSKLVTGGTPEALVAAAEGAEWVPPATLTAVIVEQRLTRTLLEQLDPRTLPAGGEDVPGLEDRPDHTVLLVPDAVGRARQSMLRVMRHGTAWVGPARPWAEARASYLRALQASRLGLGGDQVLDTDDHLVELVLGADLDALTELRARVLRPLEAVSPAARAKLTETLRTWLLHQGRRDDIARALFVHPQTVRYRMGQLRELYGDALADPHTILELTVALGGSARRPLTPDGAAEPDGALA